MEQYFPKIEKYLKGLLNEEETEAFDNELKSNRELFEKYLFYKKLQDKREEQKEIRIDFNKKIAPDFFLGSDKNRTRSKNRIVRSNIYISTIFIVAILSGIIFIYLPEKSMYTGIELAYSAKIDSFLFEINKKDKQLQLISDTKSSQQTFTRINSENMDQYIREIESKDKELESIKSELALTKQELYKNGSRAGVESIENITAHLTNKIEISWQCKNRVAIKVMNAEGNQISASEGSVLNIFSFEIPKNGFYHLHLIPEGSNMIVKLLEVNGNTLTLWQVQ